MSIREDDLAASAMGVNVVRYKITVFIISSGDRRRGWRVFMRIISTFIVPSKIHITPRRDSVSEPVVAGQTGDAAASGIIKTFLPSYFLLIRY